MTPENQVLPEAGDLIGGRFRILEILGTGGFGTVYKALQENIGREVALKFLTPGVAKDPINVKRFRREAFHVSQLRHPNTITLYDYGQTEDELAYMVMEFLDGDALGDLIQNGGAIAWPRAAHIYIQILKSLSEAHRHGLVHRDLKPENIFLCEMFGEQDYVKVLDFGVAKMTLVENQQDQDDEDLDGDALTRAGRIFGTPLYMAPEQACAEPITPATDVYALGLLLFEMVTGQPPVTGRNRMDVIHKQIRDPVPVLTDELKGTPIAELIQKACEKEPEHRFPDAPALLEHFYQALRQMQIQPQPQGGSRPEISGSHLVPPEVEQAQQRSASPPPSSPQTSGPDDATEVIDPPDVDATELFDARTPSSPAGHGDGPPKVEVRRLDHEDDTKPDASAPNRPFQTHSHSRPRYDLPLIGRDREFDKLSALARDAHQTSTGHMVLVEGEGGIGKTHLLHAVISDLSDDRFKFSTSAFRKNSLPMEALREAIAGLWNASHRERSEVDRIIREDLQKTGSFSSPEIDGIVEFLRPQSANLADVAGSDAGVLYARLERLLIRLAEQRTIVLALEDMQYADSATLAFLEYLAVTVRTHACPIVIYMTMRPEQRGLNPNLDQHLHTISANIGVGFTRVRLRRLRGRSLAVFLDSILPLESRLKERVGWLCQGVPLHAIQIIRYLQNEGELVREDERWHLQSGNPRSIDLPPDLMEMMSLRIQQAIDQHDDRPHLHRILQWIAVLGMQVPLELLQQVLDHAEDFGDDHDLDRDLHALSEEALCRQSLHQNMICVEFENSLLREGLLDEIREQWSTRNLHHVAASQKAEFYQARQSEVPLVEIADHWRQAGEMERYRDTLAASCRRSMERFDLRGARDRYRELLNLLEQRNEQGQLWTEAHLALADLARRFGEFGLAEDHYRQVVDSGAASGTEKSRALRGFAHLLRIQSHYKQATQLYSQALDWSQQIRDPEGLAKALVGLSGVHLMQGDPRAGRKVRERLESMLGEIESQEVHGKVLLHLAEAAQRQGKLQQRYDYLVRARQALERSSDRQGLSNALIDLGGALMQPSLDAPDRFEKAEQLLQQALELKRSLGDRHGVADAFRQLGHLEMERHNFDDAEVKLARSLAINQALGTPFSIGATQNSLGVLHLLTQRYQSAERHFDASIDTFKNMGDQIAISQPLLNKGIVAINQHQFNQAQTYLREARRLKESLGTSWALFDLRNNLALVEMWFGQFESAEKLLKETLTHVDEHGTAEDRATARSLMGLLQCFQSRLQMAALELGRARADAEELHIDRVSVFCRANAAFYALLTESDSAYEELIVTVDDHRMLSELDREVWLDLLAKMAQFTADRDKTRQSVRLLRAVAKLNARYERLEQAQNLQDDADLLEENLQALNP